MILENDRKKVITFRIVFGIVIFIIIIGVIIYFNLINKTDDASSKNNQNISQGSKSNEDEETIFEIDNILLYSSANALNNSETQKDY